MRITLMAKMDVELTSKEADPCQDRQSDCPSLEDAKQNGGVVKKTGSITDDTDTDDQDTTTDRLLSKKMLENSSNSSNIVIEADELCEKNSLKAAKGDETKSKLKFWRHFRRKENLVCLAGSIALVIGVTLAIISIFIMAKQCPQEQGVESTESNGVKTSSPTHISNISMTTTAAHVSSTVRPTLLHNDKPNTTEEVRYANLAEGKPCTQSTTHQYGGQYYYAGLAVDGDRSHGFSQGSCSQTEWEESPYWFADLGELKLVKRVKIIVPSDCCAGEMHNFEIRIGQQRELGLNPLCRLHMGTALQVAINIECERQLYGRYVSIQILGDETWRSNRLTLCEIMVYKR